MIIYFFTLFGELLLIIAAYIKLAKGYNQFILFLVQVGCGSQYVALYVALLLLISLFHRVKMFTIIATINIGMSVFYPILRNKLDQGQKTSIFISLTATGVAIIASCLIKYVPDEMEAGAY